MTGVEAISNGVLAFKRPEWKHAQLTMLLMSGILGSLFLGITYLAHAYQVIPVTGQTVVSQLGRKVFGTGLFYYLIQAATLLILLLAANTSYSDFPRLASLLARDRFLPRQLMLLGDRLVYANGIILLSILSALLITVFGGSVNAIIPLYAVGVFTSFTLSQAGMVRHWFQAKEAGWQSSAIVNGIGAMATATVLVVLVITKFTEGAWLVVLLIPLVVRLFLGICNHYQTVSDRLALVTISSQRYPLRPATEGMIHPAILLVGQIHRGTLEALDYTRSIADEIIAVHVDISNSDREQLQQQWQQIEPTIPLIILESSYRSIVQPLITFVTETESQYPNTFCTIVLPVLVTHYSPTKFPYQGKKRPLPGALLISYELSVTS